MTGLDVVLAVGLTARISRFITEDRLMRPVRYRVQTRYPPKKAGVGYIISCPWCASIYVGALVVAARPVPGWTAVAVVGLASYVAGILGQWSED